MTGMGFLQDIVGFKAENMALSKIKFRKVGEKQFFKIQLSNKKITKTQLIFYFTYNGSEINFRWKSMGAIPRSEREIDKLRLMVESTIVRVYGLIVKGGS